MTTLLIIISCLLAISSIVLAFRPHPWAPLLAFGALSLLYLSKEANLSAEITLFWGVASYIAFGIGILLPKEVSKSRIGVPYITIATLAGTFTGMILSYAGMVIGAIIGAVCGAVAFSRTPKGKVLNFPSPQFFNYTCAKGLPTVVTTCVCGICAFTILSIISPTLIL